MSLMPGFKPSFIRANGVRIHAWTGGAGPAVVLLHGYPQSGIMWRKVVHELARTRTVVVPDLRGYGDSDKPRDGYDKRTMAADIHAVMTSLGHERYAVVGHDRGARVAHRLALDHEQAVERLSEGRTVIAIAHRLSTAERADRVVVVDGGRIVEVGHHRDLVGAQGAYTSLHRSWVGPGTVLPS